MKWCACLVFVCLTETYIFYITVTNGHMDHTVKSSEAYSNITVTIN